MDQNEEEKEEEKIEVEPVTEEGLGPADPADKIKRLKSDLERSEKERREYLDGWQRAKADFINYKRDEGKRAEELFAFATAALIQELLVVLDSFDLALGGKQSGTDDRGVLLIRAQLEDILKRHGLEAVTVAAGDAFNPERHEAIGQEASDVPEGTIASILQKGYMLRGRIIRPARVKISKNQ